jgi:hypothetical protein
VVIPTLSLFGALVALVLLANLLVRGQSRRRSRRRITVQSSGGL